MDKVEKRKENHAQGDAVGSGFPLFGGITILIVTRHSRKKGEVDSKTPEKEGGGGAEGFWEGCFGQVSANPKGKPNISSHKASQKRKAPPTVASGKG